MSVLSPVLPVSTNSGYGTSRLISGVTVTVVSGSTVTTAYVASPPSGWTLRIANRAGLLTDPGSGTVVTCPPLLPPVNSMADVLDVPCWTMLRT